MIKNFTIICMVLFALTTGITGCKKYLDVGQTNPNITNNPPIEGLLANVTYQSALNVFRAGYFTANYVQYLSSSNKAGGSDIYEDLDRSSLWSNVYDIIQDSRKMKLMAEERKAYYHIGVAEATEAMNMDLLVDLFGDVPYSKAWDLLNFNPAYDKGQDVYQSCLKLLDDAIVQFSKTDAAVDLGSNDLIHAGSASAWLKTCHVLKARLLNKVSKQSSYNAATVLAEITLGYTSNANDAKLTQFISLSPWNQIAVDNKNLLLDGWLSTQFVNAVNGTTYGYPDPRIGHMATITKFGDFRGTPNGAGRIGTGTSKDESYIGLGTGSPTDTFFYAKPMAPLLLVTYAEMKFIEAEAAFSTDKTRSYNAYLAGIAAHMDKLGVNAVAKAAYLANAAVAVGAAALTKDLIFKEKYIAMFLHPEAWVDARRYDYKYKNFALPANALLTTFIRRQGYPTSEETRNKANVPTVGALSDHLWWDQP